MGQKEWTKSLSVGVKLIDEQHKTLIQQLNSITAAIEVRQGEREIIKALGFLADYADLHFSTEEKYMRENSYPGLKDHLPKHAEFRSTLAQLEQDLEEDGATPALADSINALLLNWLINHIRKVDREFGAYLKKKA